MFKHIYIILITFTLFACQQNEELCNKVKGPIVLDFKLGMTKSEYTNHRNTLVKSKQIIPSPSGNILEGNISSSWLENRRDEDYDYFMYNHFYYDPERDDTWNAGFRIAIVPTFSNITNTLIAMDLFVLPYNDIYVVPYNGGVTLIGEKFIGEIALIKDLGIKYGTSEISYKRNISSEGLEQYYLEKKWVCDNIEISVNSTIKFSPDSDNAKGELLFRDLNSHMRSQKQVEIGFPEYYGSSSISYTDRKGVEDMINQELKSENNLEKSNKRKAEELNKREMPKF